MPTETITPNQKKALLYGCSTVLIWSTVATAFTFALEFLMPVQLVFFATVISLCFLLCVLAVQGRLGAWRTLQRRDLMLCAVLGFFNPFLYYLVLFEVYNVLPAQIAQPVNYTWSIMLALLSVPILGHSMRPLEWLAIAISYLGVVIIASHGELHGFANSNFYGLSIAILSTVIWSLYWIISTKSHVEPVLALTLCFLFALPWTIMANLFTLGWSAFLIPLSALPYAIYIGLFEMGLSFVLWLYALRYATSVGRITNLIFFAPFISLWLISIFVGESILPSTLVGLCFIIAGNLVQQYAKPK